MAEPTLSQPRLALVGFVQGLFLGAAASNPTARSLEYRPDIDGLRGIAILLVVVFHVFPPHLPGGFVGVDVFFVISGFLITAILRSELERGQFSVVVFYARRCRRILPALLLVLAAVWLFGRATLMLDDFLALGKHLTGAAFFVSNHVLWAEAGYFDVSIVAKPLMHLWSLAVEEQFYIVWPLLLALVYRRGGARSALAAVVVGGVVSLGLFFLLSADATLVFYSIATRAWELAIGCALSLMPPVRPAAGSTLRSHALSSLGGALVLLGVVLASSESVAWALLLPTCGAALIVRAGPRAIVNRLLSLSPCVQLGLISYPLYLWHWPIVSFSHLGNEAEPSITEASLGLVAAVALAFVTRHAVEVPVQRSVAIRAAAPRAARPAVASGLAGLALVAALGWGTWRGDLSSARQELGARLAGYAAQPRPAYENGTCFLGDPSQGWQDFPESCSPPVTATGPNVVVWGDSYAAELFHSFAAWVREPGGALMAMAASSCAPVLGAEFAGRPNCAAINDFVFARIQERRYSAVILASDWLVSYVSLVQNPTLQRIDDTIDRLRRAGVRDVLLVGQMPRWQRRLSKVLITEYLMLGRPIPEDTSSWLKPRVFEVDAWMRAHFARRDVKYVPLLDVACPMRRCNPFIDGDPEGVLWTFDDGHPTPEAARRYAALARPWIAATAR